MRNIFRHAETMFPAGEERDRELEEVGVTEKIQGKHASLNAPDPIQIRTPEPVPATKGLATNLQRAVDLYEQRANQLQCTIDAATSERSDVIKARDAAKLALEALVTDVMEAAVAADLAEDVE